MCGPVIAILTRRAVVARRNASSSTRPSSAGRSSSTITGAGSPASGATGVMPRFSRSSPEKPGIFPAK